LLPSHAHGVARWPRPAFFVSSHGARARHYLRCAGARQLAVPPARAFAVPSTLSEKSKQSSILIQMHVAIQMLLIGTDLS
jgi:hypothetical protein